MDNCIYIFSDSHNVMFSDRLYWGEDFVFKYRDHTEDSIFKTRMGASFTAHSLHTHDAEIREALKGLENNKVWFCYGEIDCRAYISDQHVKNETSVEEETEKVVFNYWHYVDDLKKNGYNNISIVSIVPTYREGGSKAAAVRKHITETFNSRLKHHCNDSGIDFIDIYHLLVDPEDGFNRHDMLLPYSIAEEARTGRKDNMH